MGFLDKFISVEKTDKHEVVEKQPVSKLKANVVAPKTTPLTMPISAMTVSVDPKIVGTLEAAVANSTPAEYVQFRAFFDSLSALPENLRYTTAISVAGAANLSGTHILRAMDQRIAGLDAERAKFESWATKEYDQSVTGREKAATEAQRQIEEMAAEIQVLTNKLNTLKIESSAEKTRLEDSAKIFMAAHDSVLTSLKAERDIVANLLTSTK